MKRPKCPLSYPFKGMAPPRPVSRARKEELLLERRVRPPRHGENSGRWPAARARRWPIAGCSARPVLLLRAGAATSPLHEILPHPIVVTSMPWTRPPPPFLPPAHLQHEARASCPHTQTSSATWLPQESSPILLPHPPLPLQTRTKGAEPGVLPLHGAPPPASSLQIKALNESPEI